MGDKVRKTVKRKRAVSAMMKEEMDVRIEALEEKMRGPFGYFKKMTVGLSDLEESAAVAAVGGGRCLNGVVAVLLKNMVENGGLQLFTEAWGQHWLLSPFGLESLV